ncbi:2-polyprenyl-3-methyl-6-methoxy-1,4-benzoquinone monooxygenase [Pelomonas aquatica]|jgi:ubiquinone biosynthesis monooxygenase Coq7|uniref:3-demethoxyubiquinol 3-hydroxylase n=1 Tax=Pelomonas aquatica TaxID=431058 RepID=A0A9X4LF87_9BURK|nr:2-polyprenyl-3-methyl-6-methoxy-1,4-benzoquinone monooxygenase [Pelomonas aquatica]MCY4754058.1 2-polyprenyl-3-methyl-6-methoxy-1,4-benzoquinone monooxygenase [Pelomonas aquatica]MDG0862357.1 2-polyprenyl-3-methyl-6-methoxy-1,4-benzoquinone monooxygenase [Pelomonas aquatica]
MQSLASPPHLHSLSLGDRCLCALDAGLRTVFTTARATRPSPAAGLPATQLPPADTREAGALMRVNHVGEICAQALYQSQALFSRSDELRQHFEKAAQEELDHLAWTAERVAELDTHTSHLAPLWWAGAFAWGSLAGLAGDKWSLGFVVETERQVEAHLASHLDRLPADDAPSRAIVDQMKREEAEHADAALAAGALPLPAPIRGLMRAAARVMTTVAHHV